MRAFARLSLGLALAAPLLGGCSLGPRPARGGGAPPDPHFITLDEIRRSGEATAYDVVESLRPMWFHKRGQQSILFDGDIQVYNGDARLGDRSVLHEIAATSIASLRFLDAKDATYRYGASHLHGVIVISTVFPVDR